MIRAGARAGAVEPLDAVVLGEIRAALAAGAAPAAALAAVRSGPLEAAARAARLGRPLSEIAAATGTGDVTADLLVRALALAEHAGSGACEAVDQALAAMRSEWALARLLAVRTVQARATAVILTAVPALAWALLVATDRSTVAFYATPLGLATGFAATILAAGGFGWSRRIVSAAQRAADRADPLSAPRPRPDVGRILVVALPAFALASLALGFGAGLLALVAGGAVGLKRGSPPADEQSSDGRSRRTARDARARAGVGVGGAAEAIELVATALTAGLSPTAALAATAPLAPEAARPVLAAAARRMRSGWAAGPSLAGTGLARLGEALAASERWGAPSAPALRQLAEELRADRRAAAEAAAERAQIALIFPTTLLTLPAFVLAVVPPLLWTAVAGTGGVGLS